MRFHDITSPRTLIAGAVAAGALCLMFQPARAAQRPQAKACENGTRPFVPPPPATAPSSGLAGTTP